MIVCICRNVSERAVRAAIAGGADSVEAVGVATGAGTGCGCCRRTIAAIIAAEAVPAAAGAGCAACPRRAVEAADPARGGEAPPLRAAAGRLP